ncbi:MAG: recombination protein RecR [Gammaproteobacteria bacterium]|nr:MAG: recombination protein RecR [Gammaproteobacteria bacterium]
MTSDSLIEQLIQALRVMPGIGPKSAQRIAFHLLQRDRDGGKFLSRILADAMEGINNCKSCRNLTEQAICEICDNPKRDHSILCVVESPIDVMALEQATDYRGLYFVLMGHLSPLDGIGPEDIGMDLLAEKFKSGEIREVILATNPTVEGEATAFYISDMAKQHNISCTRIAHGVPLGGELEYIDKGTLAHAFSGRMEMR